MAFLIPAGVAAGTAASTAAAAGTAAATTAATTAAVAGTTAATATTAAAASSIPAWVAPTLSVLGTAGQLFSGMSERLSVAAQRRAEADELERQSRRAARQEFKQGVKVAHQGQNIAAASGLDITSGSPLTIMIDNIRTAGKNAQQVYEEGMTGANLRRREGSEADNPWSLLGMGSSILSDFVRRRYA